MKNQLGYKNGVSWEKAGVSWRCFEKKTLGDQEGNHWPWLISVASLTQPSSSWFTSRTPSFFWQNCVNLCWKHHLNWPIGVVINGHPWPGAIATSFVPQRLANFQEPPKKGEDEGWTTSTWLAWPRNFHIQSPPTLVTWKRSAILGPSCPQFPSFPSFWVNYPITNLKCWAIWERFPVLTMIPGFGRTVGSL